MSFSEIFKCICEPCVTGFYYICCCFKKKYKCDICESRFQTKHQLASHIRKSHSEIYAWGNSAKFRAIIESEKLI